MAPQGPQVFSSALLCCRQDFPVGLSGIVKAAVSNQRQPIFHTGQYEIGNLLQFGQQWQIRCFIVHDNRVYPARNKVLQCRLRQSRIAQRIRDIRNIMTFEQSFGKFPDHRIVGRSREQDSHRHGLASAQNPCTGIGVVIQCGGGSHDPTTGFLGYQFAAKGPGYRHGTDSGLPGNIPDRSFHR